MMTRKILMAAVAGFVSLSGLARAHEGHEHQVMGKVVAVDDQKIEVLGADGKKVTAQLSPATKYLRGKAATTRADVKVGERVVLATVQEKGRVNAKQVLLGEAAAQSGGKN